MLDLLDRDLTIEDARRRQTFPMLHGKDSLAPGV